MTSTKPSGPPRRHHFLPEHYQRLWAGDDGRVERFFRGHDGQVRSRRLAPAGVGWSEDLYRIPGEEDAWAAQRVESEFFAQIDGAAAAVMHRMRETGSPPTTGEERTAWAMFVLAFLHRTPEHMSATLAKMVEMNASTMGKHLQDPEPLVVEISSAMQVIRGESGIIFQLFDVEQAKQPWLRFDQTCIAKPT